MAVFRPQKHGLFVKEDVSTIKQDPDSFGDVLGTPLKHGLYHLFLFLLIHVLD
jgi:hypothetical protein